MNKEEISSEIKLIAPEYKSVIKIGNIVIYQEKYFNWFNRLMFKIIFNIEVKKYKGEENE